MNREERFNNLIVSIDNLIDTTTFEEEIPILFISCENTIEANFLRSDILKKMNKELIKGSYIEYNNVMLNPRCVRKIFDEPYIIKY